MSIDPRIAELNRKNDRAIVTWLFVAIVVIAVIAASFAIWRTSISRAAWFERAAQMDSYGVEVDATVVAKQCGARSVKYAWKWNEKDYAGNGGACNAVCSDLKLGTVARVRFLPASPQYTECLPIDISRKVGPPSYWDALIFIFIGMAALLVPVLRNRK